MSKALTSVEQHPAITAYEKTINGIPDCFDYLTAQAIRDITAYAVTLDPTTTVDAEADKFIRGHFEYLSTWHDAIDQLDSELRSNVVAGGLPDAHALYLAQQALGLFAATTDLQRAACEYHHGTAGPALSGEYGYAYALSNSVLSPFLAARAGSQEQEIGR